MTHCTPGRRGLASGAAVGFAAGYLSVARPHLLRAGATDGQDEAASMIFSSPSFTALTTAS